ncbi:ubiquitin-protein transferase activity protein, partial [Halocaridina rubra]
MLSSDRTTPPVKSQARTSLLDNQSMQDTTLDTNVASTSQKNNPAQKKARKYSSTLHVSLSSQNKVSEHTTEKHLTSLMLQKSVPDSRTPDDYESIATPLEEKERLVAEPKTLTVGQPESISAPSSARNSLLLEDYDISDEDEESVSITTGRLSLSLNAESINVKSEVIQTAQVPVEDHEQDTDKDNFSDPLSDKKKDIQSTADRDAISTEGKIEDIVEADQDKQNNEQHSVDEPGMAQTRTGPVTVQKASVIVGKAIAKAMARETSVRESLSRSVTPEVQETTLTTPEPSEEEEEQPPQATVSDSDDEEHLRTLDTIPEEEEISDRTDSRISRSASRNLFLPFNPTDVIQLSPVAKTLRKLVGSKTGAKMIASPTDTKKTPSNDNIMPGTPHNYYNASPQHTYYNESKEQNYYNESGAKIEGGGDVVSKTNSPDDYESMAEVKEYKDELSIVIQNDEVADSTNGETPSPNLSGDDDDDDETIYYEEVDMKPSDVSESIKSTAYEGDKSEASSTGRRRRRRKRGKGQGEGNSGTSSRVDINESPAPGVVSSTIPPTPSPTPYIESVPNSPSNPDEPTAEGIEGNMPIVTGIKKSDQDKHTITDTARSSSPSLAKTARDASSKTSLPELAGESKEEERGTSKTVSVYDRLKVPSLLVQIEDLKARHGMEPDYQEVRELKEQIQMMRKQLEAKMEEDGEGRPDTPETPQDEELPPMGPVILLAESPETERPPSREYEQLKFDRTVRRLLAERQAGSYEKAELAAQLMSFNFQELDALQAAEECSSIYTAIHFLQQECELCAEKYPMGKMVSMLQCIHRCCKECAKTYFTFQIKTKNIRDLRCPFCNEPDFDACEEIANEYLNNMDILLKNIIDAETHELFQRKLRDWTLMKDPNFRWCNKCSSGFIANPRARKLICPDCKDVTCAHCRATWENAHDGITCEAFAQWKADNDLEVQAQGVAKHLAENGITCPKCKFTYSLAKGGCMHFTCTQCKYEFCSGCGQPFRQGSRCPVGPYCERLGLHAHHPRNCLFYLRDKEPHQLQNLLKDAGISYDTESKLVSENPGQKRVCLVQEQKELPDGLKDDICGRIVPEGYAGLCRTHFIEYLARLIFTFNLDPLPLMDEEELRFILRRDNLEAPKRHHEETNSGFLTRIVKGYSLTAVWRLASPFDFFFFSLLVSVPFCFPLRLHYTEYLVEKINTHKLDPVSIFDEADLRVCLRRNGKPVPVRRWESEKLYRDKLIK